ncbi:MAG: sulfite exporter TauE/SafE family protein [Deltaproteobacteria bacterium]|nr:sulfite exporter TauE/SafE family protein [Deltaproteobacteria bacterium]
MMQTPLLFLFGLAVGTIGTMMGVGGGFLHVPVFTLLLGLPPQAAIATSIAVIFINTFGGSVIYYFQGRMDVDLAKKLSLAVAPGAIFGPFIVEQYTSSFFFVLFSCALILCALHFLFGKGRVTILPKSRYDRTATIKDAYGQTVSYSTNVELGVVGTLLIGFLSNLLGVGGGIVHVPFLISVLKIPTHVAIGTSHAILCASSFLGTVMFTILQRVEMNIAFPTGIGAIIGATIGADLARKTSGVVLRKMLALALMMIGMKMLFKTL